MAVGAKTKTPQVAQATTFILNGISGGKFLSLTDMLENGLRLRDMWFYLKWNMFSKWTFVLRNWFKNVISVEIYNWK